MALNNIVRRAASRVVPLAIRVAGGSQRYNHHCSALFAAVKGSGHPSGKFFQRSLPSAVHHYSSRPASDDSLLRVIQSEIECAEEEDGAGQVDDVPENFPFKLEDNPGQQTVTLTRNYQGETITVEVHMSSLVTGEEDDDVDNDDERGNQSQLPLVVKVAKNDGPCLEFGCTAFPDEISIDSLSIRDPDSPEDQIAYEGPEFGELDENLQKAFHKYLEIRGVKPSTTNFLHEYMINKDSREYRNWLMNLKKFIEA